MLFIVTSIQVMHFFRFIHFINYRELMDMDFSVRPRMVNYISRPRFEHVKKHPGI